MKTIRVNSLAQLRRELQKTVREKERLLDQAARKAARRHRSYLMTHMPVAFGELRSSVKVVGTKVVVDSPYAAAVERGSRPHWMPLEPLIKWVKLRGFQGLASAKAQARLPGTTSVAHAKGVAGMLADHRRGWARGGGASGPQSPFSSFSVSEDGTGEQSAAVDVAKAIQLAIALKGTKPTWFMRDSMPHAREFLREEIHAALSRGRA